MKELQSVYNQIINILKKNNVLINITPPRPYLIKKDDEERINAEAESLLEERINAEAESLLKERINAEAESLLKEGKIKEYNSKRC